VTPRALLFDLDDTILSAYGQPEAAWLAVSDQMSEVIAPLRPVEAAEAIAGYGREFWSDPARHQAWRMRMQGARREIVAGAFMRLGNAGSPLPRPGASIRLADRFSAYREEQMHLFPDAHAVLDELRRRNFLLALVTNGAADVQRAKIARFDLAARFDHVQIEGEVGFGKPEEQAYRHALAALGVDAGEAWMIGDDLEWEVAAPQRLGMSAVWHDVAGRGLPAGVSTRPDLIIGSLTELLPHLE
jgi:putative hydrolase of the HAD superfamily